MALINDLLQKIKRNTLDRTNIDERIVNAVKPRIQNIQRNIPIVANKSRQLSTIFRNNLDRTIKETPDNFQSFYNPFSKQFQARNRQFAQQANTLPNFSQPLEGIRKATPGASLMFKEPLAPDPANKTQRALRLGGAAIPSFINAGARGVSALKTAGEVSLSALFGGGINKAMGGDFGEGLSGGVEAFPMIQNIGGITSPLISKTASTAASRFNNPFLKALISRTVAGAGNIPEGIAMNTSLGQGYSLPNAGIDFLTGTVLGAGAPNVKGDIKSELMAGEKATGFKNAPGKFSSRLDKKPRFEISDRQASIRKLPETREGLTTTLEKVLNHEGLFKQYPNFRNLTIKFEDMGEGTRGRFDGARNTITVNPNLDRKQLRSTVLHEVQHAIQKGENFAKGGSYQTIKTGATRELFNKYIEEGVPQLEAYTRALNESDRYAYRKYRGMAGEVESRAVQAREGLSPEQRRSIDPYAATMKEDKLKLPDITTQFRNADSEVSTPIDDSFFFRRTRAAMKGGATAEPSTGGRGLMGVFKPNADTPQNELEGYVKSMKNKQENAKVSGASANIKKVMQNIRTLFEDYTAPIEDAVGNFEKTSGAKILPTKDVRPQIDRAIRADSIATRFIKDNGLDKIIQQVDDLGEFNQYLIAKQARDVAAQGKETGRNLQMDEKLLTEFAPKYEQFSQQLNNYNVSLRKYLVDSGLISQELSDTLGKRYPNYVPLKRVFNEVEQEAMRDGTGRGGAASIGTQSVVKKLEGSEREIIDPLESILESTAIAFREGERNKAAQMLVGYVKNKIIPGKVLDSSETTVGKNTVSALIDGKKVQIETSPEIAQAAKNLNSEQIAAPLKLLSVFTRTLRLGATGLNVPFTLGNLAKDQITAAIMSDKPLRTSILNPKNFIAAILSSAKQDDLYKQWEREGASFTQFDIGRDQTPITIDQVRSGKDKASRIKYIAKNPGELIRAVEDLIGTTEEITRLQQFRGTKGSYLDKGRTEADSNILAAQASRNNTTNFGRRGAWGQVLNSAIPFFNAGIQGARTLRNSFKNDPVGTSFRFAATLGVPTVAITAWNLSDPDRREIYEDIPDWEKDGSLIIVPPNATQDEDGNYNVIKIPVPPGVGNLASIIRRETERLNGLSPDGLGAAINDLFVAATSQPLANPAELATQNTPQAIKLAAEPTLNVNFFTKEPIEPWYMQEKPPAERFYDSTSGTARKLGEIFNKSPLKIENVVNTAAGGVGKQALNLSDRILAATGQIDEDQIGGRSIMEDFQYRFGKARGGEIERKANEPDFGYGKKADAASEDVPPALPEGSKKTAKVSSLSANKVKRFNTIFGTEEISKLPEKNNYEKAQKKTKQFNLVNDVLNSEKLTESEKDAYLQTATDLKKEEIGYYKIARGNYDERYGFVLDKLESQPNDILKTLATMRYSIDEKKILTNNIVDKLEDEGYISDSDAKLLKKLEYDQATGQIKRSGSGSGSSSSSSKKLAKAIADFNQSSTKDLRSIFESFSSAKTSKRTSSAKSLLQITKTLNAPKSSNPRKIEDILSSKRTIKPTAKLG